MHVGDTRTVAKVRVEWVKAQKEFLDSIGIGKAFKNANKRFRKATFELALSLNNWSRVLIGRGLRQYHVKDEGEFDGAPAGKRPRLVLVSDMGPDQLAMAQWFQASNYCFGQRLDVNHVIWNATRSALRFCVWLLAPHHDDDSGLRFTLPPIFGCCLLHCDKRQ